MLLKGHVFKNVKSMDKGYLKTSLMSLLYYSDKDIFYMQVDEQETSGSNEYEFEMLIREKEKIERALDRLKKLFLFDDEGMSEKEFLIQQKELKDKLQEINKKLKVSKGSTLSDISEFQKLSNLIILKELTMFKQIDIKELLNVIEKEVLRDFFISLIKEIVVKDGKVISILFHNGIINRFIY